MFAGLVWVRQVKQELELQSVYRSMAILTDAADIGQATLADGYTADASALKDRLTGSLHGCRRGIR